MLLAPRVLVLPASPSLTAAAALTKRETALVTRRRPSPLGLLPFLLVCCCHDPQPCVSHDAELTCSCSTQSIVAVMHDPQSHSSYRVTHTHSHERFTPSRALHSRLKSVRSSAQPVLILDAINDTCLRCESCLRCVLESGPKSDNERCKCRCETGSTTPF